MGSGPAARANSLQRAYLGWIPASRITTSSYGYTPVVVNLKSSSVVATSLGVNDKLVVSAQAVAVGLS